VKDDDVAGLIAFNVTSAAPAAGDKVRRDAARVAERVAGN
jgi:hypothetical protein